MIVTVRVNAGDEFKATWPGATLKFCGEMIKDRICDKGSIDPDGPGGAVKISFGKTETPGWNLDDGSEFKERAGISYGWS